MMQFVDYDREAARRAADACRTAAGDLRDAVRMLDGPMGDHLAGWAGDSRIEMDAAAVDLLEALTAEAEALEATADDIDAATSAAGMAEFRRYEAHQAELRRQREAEAALPPGVR